MGGVEGKIIPAAYSVSFCLKILNTAIKVAGKRQAHQGLMVLHSPSNQLSKLAH
jgi:hypothetical protein